MDHEPKTTLAEFSRIYLRSLQTPAIIETAPGEEDADGRFAARVALGMSRAVRDRERQDR
jgi:hypothetical protein